MWMRLAFLTPVLVLGLLAIYFTAGLGHDPSKLPSVLINKPVPEFTLAAIDGSDRGLSSTDLKGRVVLVNVFGSWCIACLVEHPFLMKLKTENIIPIYGIDWREPDRKAGPDWLKKRGNPYTLIGDDPKSRGAIAFGVSGAPETFIVDKTGIIRYKYLGPLNPSVWSDTLFPIVEKLRRQ